MLIARLLGGASIEAERGVLTGQAAQRHRLALLSLLAASLPSGLSRDKLIGLLWPDSGTERARNLLNQAVHALRRALGEGAILSLGEELRLDPQVVSCDAVAFQEAIATGDLERAVGLYRGPFLDGFFLSDAPGFEHWVDRERERLADVYAKALETLAEAAEEEGDPASAVEWWKARAAHDPYDSRIALRLMQALEASGNRAGAVQHSALHQRLLQEEFGLAAPPEISRLAERLRRQPAAAAVQGGKSARALAVPAPDSPASGAIHDHASFDTPGASDAPHLEVQGTAPPPPAQSVLGRRYVAPRRIPRQYVLTALAAAALGASVLGLVSRDSDTDWLREEAVPRIEEHLDVPDWESAFALAREADARVPGSRELAELWPRIAWRVTIRSEPAGATVFRQAYGAAEDSWEEMGRTPLVDVRVPYGLSRLRLELGGHAPLLRALGGAHINWQELRPGNPDGLLVGPETYRLDPDSSLPADMVRVPGGSVHVAGESLEVDDFFIGRHEVTNAEFKRFVDAGGYELSRLWDPVVVKGDTLSWNEASALFVDRTGRPGPGTWEAGDYPEGEGDLPVSGVSWYEAAAYARYVGRELPTAHHWQHALANAMFPWLLPASNFSGDGPRRVTASRAMSHVGTFDMAGNVREWTATAIGEERIILGGSWNDPYYIAGTLDTSAPPEDRSAGNGLRLAITSDEPAIAVRLRAPQSRTTVSPTPEPRSVSDAVYAAYSRVFDYDRGPLDPAVEAVDTTRVWIRERVWFNAGYGAERMLLHLYRPTTGRPPYQTVIYWPGWDTFALDDADEYFAKQVDFIVKSGRAVAFPMYRGTFNRRAGNLRKRADFGTAEYRDNAIQTVKDLRRSIDYLETRPDIDRSAVAFFGYSWGGVNGPVAMAQEPRIRAGIIQVGLLPPMDATPEVDPIHSLPRVRIPLLLFSGEFDPMVPAENARRYFASVGTPAAQKRHVVAIGGHFIPRHVVIRGSLEWLDRYLGPVRR